MTALSRMTVSELSRLVRVRDVSAKEVTESSIAAIEKLNPSIGAVITLLADEALQDAERIDRRLERGEAVGPLAGVPFGVKDVIYAAGTPTSGGSRIYRGLTTDWDGPAVARLKQAGAVLTAKLSTMEFNYGDEVDAGYPVVKNPWRLDHYAGGSSSGSGASVAARMLPLALGEDTGGSVRLPASNCGVVGLKPTYGRVPRTGMMSLAWSMDHLGLVARSVEDLAMALEVTAGHHDSDPTASNKAVPDYLATLERGAEDVVIGVPKSWFFDDVDPEVERAVRQALETLSDAGASIVEIDVPLSRLSMTLAWIIWGAELASLHESLPNRFDQYGESMAERIMQGMFWSSQDYLRAQRVRHMLQLQFQDAFRTVDAVVVPSSPAAAGEFKGGDVIAQIGDREVQWIEVASRLTSCFNLTGMPAAVVPCGFTSKGMPIGLQIAAPPHQDGLTLRLAKAYLAAVGWSRLPEPPDAH